MPSAVSCPPCRRRWTWALLCASCGAADMVRPPPPSTDPLPGTERLRMAPDDVLVGHTFTTQDPWVLEFDVPADALIPGDGLPAWPAGTTQVTFDPTLPDRSIVQVELPIARRTRTDEAPLYDAWSFDAFKFCPAGGPCALAEDTPGLVRVYRLRDTLRGVVIRELQAMPTPQTNERGDLFAANTMLSVWMDAAAPPLDDLDRLRVVYRGRAPRVSNDWVTGPDRPLRPRLRYRTQQADTAADCPAATPTCWTVLDDAQVQGLTLRAEAPSFLVARAPLDVVAGQPFDVEVVALDRHHNPTLADASVTLTLDGAPGGAAHVALSGAWHASTQTVAPQGRWRVEVTSDLDVTHVGQWLDARPERSPRWRRLMGDTHIHSGLDGTQGFQSRPLVGDHAGLFLRTTEALRFLDEVAGLDFGAVTEHANARGGWTLPGPAFHAFGPGGPCEVGETVEELGPWWQVSQQLAWDYDRQHPDFVVLPGWEWAGRVQDATRNSLLHRVVLFKDHQPGTFDLPLLPAIGSQFPPACLFHYLELSGRTPKDALVIPHMMQPTAANVDWDLTYAPPPPFDTLASPGAADAWQRVGEIYSARNLAPGNVQGDALLRFEGLSDDPAALPWSFRYGWSERAATLGVIGSSDHHGGKPGMDDLAPASGDTDHSHEAGGYAILLTRPDLPPREAIFEALRSRRTYATTSTRTWLAFDVVHDGVVTPMGGEVGPVRRCAVEMTVSLAASSTLRELQVFGAQVGGGVAYVPLLREVGSTGTTRTVTFKAHNPVAQGATGGSRWLYYVRASLGDEVTPGTSDADLRAGHRDAVWSSPIWVDWEPGCR